MFSAPRLNVIASDEGFEVEVLGRAGLMYRREGRALRVDSEILAPPASLAVYSGSIQRWEPPHEAETIDEAERARIVDDIRRSFAWSGHEIDVF